MQSPGKVPGAMKQLCLSAACTSALVLALACPAWAGNVTFEGESAGYDWRVILEAKTRAGKVVKIKTLDLIAKSRCVYEDGTVAIEDQPIGPAHPLQLDTKLSGGRFSYSGSGGIDAWQVDIDGRLKKHGSKFAGALAFTSTDPEGGMACSRALDYTANSG